MIKRFLTIIFGIIAGFALGEIFTRAVIKDTKGLLPAGLLIRDDLLEHKMSSNFEGYYRNREFKNYIRTNSLGLRGEEIPPKRDNETRILVLGDSFSFGAGVEEDETYSSRLEDMLNKMTHKLFKVINTGTPRWGTYNELNYLKEYGIKFKPDLIIVQFYIDAFENMNYVNQKNNLNMPLEEIGEEKGRYENFKASNHFAKIRTFAKKSMVLKTLHDRWVLLSLRFKKDYSDVSWGWTQNNEVAFLKKDTPLTEWGWQITEKALLEIAKIARENNAGVIILLTPAWCQISNIVPGDRDEYDLAKPNRILKKFAANNNISLFDPLPLLKDLESSRKFYYFYDQHWTKNGHKFIAEKLYDFILAL